MDEIFVMCLVILLLSYILLNKLKLTKEHKEMEDKLEEINRRVTQLIEEE